VRIGGAAAALAILVSVTSGCSTQTTPATPVVALTATRTPAAPATTSASPSKLPVPRASPGTGTVEDVDLLAILPADVDAIAVEPEHQAYVDAVSDEAFAQNVRRAAFGVAVSGSDLVSAVVAEPQPGTFSDSFFRDWRETYNQGACGQGGGVVGNAETQIAGRTVYITTCAGGLRTYHTWLAERGTIVSAFSLGDRRLGETLMEGLRP
jgi:hypothetical protein